jgi:protein SCO1
MSRRTAILASCLLAAALALVAVVVIVSSSPSGVHPRASDSAYATGAAVGDFDGAALPAGIAASSFTLSDEHGHRVSLGEYRGRVVVLTFLYSGCGATCIVIAQQIRGALDELQQQHAPTPAVLIVSVDPRSDTPARVAHFLAATSLSGRVEYLTGSSQRLAAVWHAYAVTPAAAGAAAFDRVASVLLIDPRGEKRVLFESEQLTPETLSHDIGLLDGAPTHP